MNNLKQKENVSVEKYILHKYGNTSDFTMDDFDNYVSLFEKEHGIKERELKQLKAELNNEVLDPSENEIIIYSNNEKQKSLIAWILKGFSSDEIEGMDDEDFEDLKNSISKV